MEDQDDVIDEDFEGLWNAFAEQWEQAFQRMSEAEDAHLQRITEQVEKLAVEKVQDIAQKVVAGEASLLSRMADSDEAAHHISRVAGAVVELERAHAVKEVHHGAAAGRASATSGAMQDSDDLMHDIEEQAAQRRREAEAKRQLAKKRREAEAAARRKSRERRASDPNASSEQRSASSGPSPPGADGSEKGAGQQRSNSRGPPPKGSRPPQPPSAHSAGRAAPKPSSWESFAEYDAAFAGFDRRMKDAGGSIALGFPDIPWPDGLPVVSGIVPEDGKKERKLKLRAAVLRWHPDKWGPVLDAVQEQSRAQVVAKVQEVTRRILDERRLYS